MSDDRWEFLIAILKLLGAELIKERRYEFFGLCERALKAK